MTCQAFLPPKLDFRFLQEGPCPDGRGWLVDRGMRVRVSAKQGPVEHAEPAALVTMAAWADLISRREGTIEIDDSVKSRYAWNVGLLRALAGRTPHFKDAQPGDAWFPLCRTDAGIGIREYGSNFGVFLKIRSQDAREALAYCVNEMVRNAWEHSLTKGSVFFAGSWFPSTNRVTFAVADAGIGIHGSLMRKQIVDAGHSHAEAIERALQPHVTGAGDPTEPGAPANAGLGLHVTRQIAKAVNGSMIVQSFSAAFREDQKRAEYVMGSWEGTVVEVSIRPNGMREFAPLFQEIALRGDTGAKWEIQFNEGPKEAVRLDPPVDSTGFAADKDWFIQSRPTLHEELAEGGLVQLDFAKARYSTQSAVHALLYDPLRTLGPSVLPRLWISRARSQVRAVVRQVVNYALDHHLDGAASVPLGEATTENSDDGSPLT